MVISFRLNSFKELNKSKDKRIPSLTLGITALNCKSLYNMKIWISRKRDVLMTVDDKHYYFIHVGNKREKSHKRKKIKLGWDRLSYPPSFIAMYYEERDFRYWHEIDRIVRTVT